MATNFLDKDGLIHFWAKIKEKFVQKELKTGSQDTYKVLSDNNLTDALVQKINDAGSSSFNGQYSALTGKPSIEGHEVATGDQTAASLGLETPSGAQAKADAAKSAAVDEVKTLGYQTSTQVESAITAKGYATADSVDSKVNAAKAELQGKITEAVSSALTYRGVKATKTELPSEGNKTGDMWHVTEDANEYAWDGTKWEPMGGAVDLSGYMKKTDMVALTNGEIDNVTV
ncbi:hypothetical protein [Collinsella tanakaei]|uniref:hypothetical protein n=1 Tax=Collinsella tanakaei TaxID=626935 RepID=UPI0022E27F83|nr:hypothetical protein [Collinsella tanakaei]